jgi:hypothetical protein
MLRGVLRPPQGSTKKIQAHSYVGPTTPSPLFRPRLHNDSKCSTAFLQWCWKEDRLPFGSTTLHRSWLLPSFSRSCPINKHPKQRLSIPTAANMSAPKTSSKSKSSKSDTAKVHKLALKGSVKVVNEFVSSADLERHPTLTKMSSNTPSTPYCKWQV